MTEKEKQEITKQWEALMNQLYLIGYRNFNRALKASIQPILDAMEQSGSILLVQELQAQLISVVPIGVAMDNFVRFSGDKVAKNIWRTYRRYIPNNASVGVGFGAEKFALDMNEYLRTIGAQHIKDIDKTTRKLVKKAFEDGLKEGDTLKQVARRIERYTLGGLDGRINKRARSLLIARTETLMASGRAKAAQIDEFEEVGVKFFKQWIHSAKVKEPRDDHKLANKTRRPKNGFWTFSGNKMKWAGDPNGGAINNCNCRCSTIFVPIEQN
jgi:hypothetical protein